MYDKYENIMKYAAECAKSENIFDDADVIAKAILAAIYSEELREEALRYVNDSFDYAAIKDKEDLEKMKGEI